MISLSCGTKKVLAFLGSIFKMLGYSLKSFKVVIIVFSNYSTFYWWRKTSNDFSGHNPIFKLYYFLLVKRNIKWLLEHTCTIPAKDCITHILIRNPFCFFLAYLVCYSYHIRSCIHQTQVSKESCRFGCVSCFYSDLSFLVG